MLLVDAIVERPYTVLLFEDSVDDEILVLRALKSCGIEAQVRVARDGEEAFNMLGLEDEAKGVGGFTPNLVISDLKMPKRSGADILALARRCRLLENVPFVIFSSSAEPNDIGRCMALGASEYCVKPVGFSEFIDCVKSIVKRWLVGMEPQEVEVPCSLAVESGV